MLRYVNRVAAQYWLIHPDSIGVCTGEHKGLTTARFGTRNCYGPPKYFAVVTHEDLKVPPEARPVFDAGVEVYGYAPTVDTAEVGYVRLLWSADGDHMDVRVRPDGKINWYGNRGGYMGGNEGWSKFDPRKPTNTPWSSVQT